MASRRVRIKGIANIPQRKKTNAPDSENKISTPPDEKVNEPNLTSDQGSHVEVSKNETAVPDEKVVVKEKEVENNDNVNKENGINDDKESKCDAINNNNNEKVSTENNVPKGLPARRKFIKPMVAVNSVNRKREKPENGVVEVSPNKENVQEVVNSLNETVIAPSLSPNKNNNVINNTSPGPISVKIKPTFIAQKDISKCGSDTEYPPPPVSPSKILNRRIKAIPKLHQRRTSFSIGSASESEDDSRRSSYGRVRNDSICSVASLATETPTTTKEAASPPRKESTTTNPSRKFRRSEQGRKIAEARRSFYQKFADGKPDKQKLTMIDLIYYNPATNPMNPRKRRETTTSTISDDPPSPKSIHTTQEDEEIDDPNNPKSEEDEDGALAPQIKVGPNGEIVIDEKSLVIENVETKKSRQALEKAEVIDGDFDTAYGVYKRAKRAKDWPNEETLRFYKALNTIGTDFTMMCELFPNRTRRELKLKFKREEKINKALIDRAVMQPVEFDMNQLRKDLEEHERIAEEKRKRAEEVKIVKEKERLRRLERKTRKKSLIGVDGLEPDESEEPLKEQKPKRKRRKKHPYDSLKKGINSLLEDTDDSDEEYRPNSNNEKNMETKRAAIPREVRKTTMDVEENNENIDNPGDTDKNLEPGSLMIVPSSQLGKTLYKVFMITDDHGKQEVDMDGKTIEQLTQQNNEKVVDIQNIITISENVIVGGEIPINTSQNNIEITKDSIIFDFDECPITSSNNSNITISHDDNKMTIVTES